jgi:hypothetical protein
LGPEPGEALGLEAVQHQDDAHRLLLVVLSAGDVLILHRAGGTWQAVCGGQALDQLGKVGAGAR